MRCPFCGHDDSQVKDSRPSEDNSAIRRRRHCPECGGRFTTFERVQLRELIVEVVDAVARNEAGDAQVEQSVARRVGELCRRFPVYP